MIPPQPVEPSPHFPCRWKTCKASYPTFKASVQHMRGHLRNDARRTQAEFDMEQDTGQTMVQSSYENLTRERASPGGLSTTSFSSLVSPDDFPSTLSVPPSPSLDEMILSSVKRPISRPISAQFHSSLASQKVGMQPDKESSSNPNTPTKNSQNEIMRKNSVSSSLPTGRADSPSNPFLDHVEIPPPLTAQNHVDEPVAVMNWTDENIMKMGVPTTVHSFEVTGSPQQSWYSTPLRKRRRRTDGEQERKNRRRSSTKHGSSKLRPLNSEESPRTGIGLRNPPPLPPPFPLPE